MRVTIAQYLYLSALCAAVAQAAPVSGAPFEESEVDARALDQEDATLELRASSPPPRVADGGVIDRDDFKRELEARGLLTTGIKWALNRVPKGHSFKTPTAKYSGHEVNQAAKDTMRKAQAGVKDKGYPKEGSGFRKSEAKADPTRGEGVAYHAPLRKKDAKGRPTGSHPGPDRVIIHQKPGKERFDVHVAYHDGKKQIPVGTGSKNHPFTSGKRKTSGGEKQRKGRRRK